MRIIATANIHETPESQVIKMILAGADVLRYNLSYQEIDDVAAYFEKIQKIKETIHSDIKIMIDMPLNKIRIGDFENQYFAVKENDELIFLSAPFSPDCHNFVPVNTLKLGEKVQANQTVSLANGHITIQIIEIINSEAVKVRVLNNGVIKERQTFNNTTRVSDAEMLNIYKNLLEKIVPFEPDYISFSYLNKEFFKLVKELPATNANAKHTKFAVKIENELADLHLNELCQDPFPAWLILDRGEIGVNHPFERLGLYQKKVLTCAKRCNKPILVSSQILYSTMDNFVPTRADISDLTQIVLDGAAGIIMGKETSHNRRPAYAISVARRIINELEKYNKQINFKTYETTQGQTNDQEQISHPVNHGMV